MVISRDWLSYTIKNTLQPQIAKGNITPRFLGIIEGVARAVISTALTLPYEPFINVEIISVEKSEGVSGQITLRYQITQSEPAKRFEVVLYI